MQENHHISKTIRAVFMLCVFLTQVSWVQAATTQLQDFRKRMQTVINQFRAANGRAPVKFNILLNRAGQRHSVDMGKNDFFSHCSPTKGCPDQRIENVGYNYRWFGENIAAGNATPEKTFTQWKNSPGHRANMLNTNAREIGVGYYLQPNDGGSVPYRYYWVLILGRQ
jgi:uncharacterized protein YkwD